jgi:hypothetical protein
MKLIKRAGALLSVLLLLAANVMRSLAMAQGACADEAALVMTTP